MTGDLLIAAGPGEWRGALVENGRVVELYVERGDAHPAGSILLGRVVRRATGLGSAFVEIGEARPGIVPLREAAADGIGLDEGAAVAVQIRRETQPGKGARLSTRLRRTVAAAAREPPVLLYPAPGFAAALALRLPAAPGTIVTDDPAAVPELRAAFPGSEIAHRPQADWPVDLDGAIEAALARRLTLADGTTLHIEEAEAAILIDIDTGTPERGSAADAALAANLAAATEIARQIRLRNLGGGIAVDFVGLEGKNAREQVRQALAAALAADPARPQVLGWTRLGHLELVRPRRARSLAAILLDPGGDIRPKNAASLAFAALRAFSAQSRATPAVRWRLVAGADIAEAFAGPAAIGLAALEARLDRSVAVEIARNLPARGFAIAAP